MGLNLSLRGVQINSKSSTGKKDKSKDVSKYKADLKSTHSSSYYSLLLEKSVNDVKENCLPATISPRPFIMDLMSSLNKENPTNTFSTFSKAAPKLKSLKEAKETRTRSILENEVPKLRTKITISRQHTSLLGKKDNLSSKSLTSLNLDSAKRHASCGPRLLPVTLQSKEVTPRLESDTIKADTNEKNELLECVGSKCGPEISNNQRAVKSENIPPKCMVKNKAARNTFDKQRLKTVNVGCGTRKSSINASDNAKLKRKSLLTGLNRQQNLTPLDKASILKKTADAYNSHLFAVGLNLRALRSKYNRILKSPNDNEKNISIAHGYNAAIISARKLKHA